MGEPARKYPHNIEPETRPNLRVIQGGSESTGRSNANLQSARPSAQDLQEQENSNVIQGPWGDTPNTIRSAEASPATHINNVTGKNSQSQIKGKFWRNKKNLWGIGIGGSIGGLLFAAFLALLPLKLEMFIQNISKQAEALPAHAVGRRAEYLVTRALAARIIEKGQGLSTSDADLVFCSKPGAIACSLFHTYTAKYFEDKMDFSFEKRTNGKVGLTINAKGRSALGAKATTWEIETTRDLGDGEILKTIKTIESNAEMKKYISGRVEKMKVSNSITRFLARRILMKKYGVTHWRAFEKTSNKIADVKSSFKAAMYKNTIGKVMPRTAMYLACLSGGATCEKLLKNFSSSVDPAKITDPKERESAQKVQEWANKLRGLQAGTSAPEGLFGKIISSNVIKVLGGAVAIIGIADIGFRAVDAIGNNGALDQIANDITKTAYIGMAFGDEAGLVVNDERMKAGDIDINVLGVASSYLDGAEQSPLMQAENGIMTATSTTQVTRDCQTSKTPSSSEVPSPSDYTYQPTQLEPGQLVCPEARMVRDYTKQLRTVPAWEALRGVANVWTHSVSLVFDVVGKFINAPLEMLGNILSQIPGIGDVVKQAGKLLEPMMRWVASLIFDIPNIGPDAPGANNYDALSGGIRAAQNELMEQGVDENGRANGGGGKVLTNTQVATIMRKEKEANDGYYSSQPVMARIFNPTLSGSFAQRFLAVMPTSFNSFGALPTQSVRSILMPGSVYASDDNVAITNPFNLPLYGYADDDPTLEADPSNYNPTSCAASAKAREDSYKVDMSVSPIATYSISDPCALEKQAAGALLNDAGVKDDPNSFPALDAGSSNTAQSGASGSVAADGWAFPTAKDATLAQPFIPGQHNAVDLAKNGDVPIFAARDGVVVAAGDITSTPPYIQPCTGPTGEIQQVIILRHTVGSDTYFTSYHHLAKGSISVSPGQEVKAGIQIAKMGNTGCSFGQHLHFELWKNSIYGGGTPIDPMTVLKRN